MRRFLLTSVYMYNTRRGTYGLRQLFCVKYNYTNVIHSNMIQFCFVFVFLEKAVDLLNDDDLNSRGTL